jgi:hypothetical protein
MNYLNTELLIFTRSAPPSSLFVPVDLLVSSEAIFRLKCLARLALKSRTLRLVCANFHKSFSWHFSLHDLHINPDLISFSAITTDYDFSTSRRENPCFNGQRLACPRQQTRQLKKVPIYGILGTTWVIQSLLSKRVGTTALDFSPSLKKAVNLSSFPIR